MAVQAQYPSNAFSVRNGVFEEVQMQYRDNQGANLLRGYNNYAGQPIFTGTVFSDLESELTCNLSGSRKRSREDHQMALTQQQQQHMSSQLRFANLPKVADKSDNPAASAGLQLSYEENRMIESAGTSTSGRSTSIFSPLCQDLASCLYQQNLEIDALIRLQSEKLRLGLEEARKRHCRSLLSILEQQVLKRLREKEMELENASRRNAELEEKVRQISAENQIWFNVAKNNEAIVSNLRTNLEQILLQNAGPAKEGYGDSTDRVGALADDAQSCCHVDEQTETPEKTQRENREMKRRKACKVCKENDVSVLLLPCRHLCLCKDCESKLDTCPICKSMKNASLQIFMS
ncbi:probable BOI-related E3 ubiquitin-protein ligase 2 [Aristolochia californica]|uniref:probable BOI-related E3 ubiquitin-protein ligase 2 n=1 Tax=Aristolochia californica TaxID=171875 RepID=UPI0035DAACB7